MEDPIGLARAILSATFLSLSALASRGIGRHLASRLVGEGRLLRVRNGRYLLPDTHHDLVRAARLGGQLDCVSLLGAMGIFVRIPDRLHVRFAPGTTRLPDRPSDVRAHWRLSARSRSHLATDIIEALAQACRCQTPRDAVATLDSALHHGIIDDEGLTAVFRLLPARHQVLRRLVDPRSESGPESIVRLLLRTMGAQIDVQVFLRGVGRVDFVVDGWLIIECDSKAHHEGWDAQRRDRRRDLAAAALGYTTIRPLAEDVLHRTDDVAAQLRLILAHGPRP